MTTIKSDGNSELRRVRHMRRREPDDDADDADGDGHDRPARTRRLGQAWAAPVSLKSISWTSRTIPFWNDDEAEFAAALAERKRAARATTKKAAR